MNKIEKESIKKIGKGAIIVLVGYILAKLLILARTTLFARGLGAADYGVFSMALTITTLASILCLFGLSQGIVHFIAKTKSHSKIKQAVNYASKFVFVSSLAVGLLLVLLRNQIALFFKMPELSWIIILFALALPFVSLFEMGIAVFEGFSSMKYRTMLKDFLSNALMVLFALVLLFCGFSLLGSSIAFLASSVIVFCIIFYLVISKVNFFKSVKDSELAKKMFSFSWPIMLSSFIYVLLNRIDILFIGHFLDSSTVAKYSVASDLSHLIIILNAVILPIFFPIMSSLISKGKVKEAGTVFRKITKFLTIFTLPALLIFVLFPEKIIFYIFGQEYAGGGIFLLVLSFASFFACVSGPINMLLKSMNKPKLVLFNSLAALLINLVLNYILIIKMGAIGVAIATVVSIFAQNYLGIAQLWLLKKIRPYDWNVLRPVLFTILIGFGAYCLKRILPDSLFYNIVLAFALLAVYGIYLLIDRKLINLGFYIKMAKGIMLK